MTGQGSYGNNYRGGGGGYNRSPSKNYYRNNGGGGDYSQHSYNGHSSRPSPVKKQTDPLVQDLIQEYKEKSKLLFRWAKYFPHESQKDFDPNDFKHLAIQVFFEAFSMEEYQKYLEWEKKEDNNYEAVVVYINYAQFFQCGNANIKQFLEFIYEHPNDLIKCIAIALDCVRFFVLKLQDGKTVTVRFTNYCNVYALSAIKSHLIGKFICLRGTALRVSSMKVLVQSIQFTCHECKAKIIIHFIDGKWETPNRCINMDCRSRIFNPEKHTAKTSFYQRLRIQEIENDMKDINAGKLPKTIDCEIRDDLIDTIISGDIVTICGIMKTELQNDMKGFGGGKNGKNKALHASYIDVNSIRNSNADYFLSTGANEQGASLVMNGNKVNISELNEIHKLAERKDIFYLLIKSLCPSIYGHELVKAGLLLAMFGGSDNRIKNKGEFQDYVIKNDDKNGQQQDDEEEDKNTNCRPDIHMLMVGDPGLGKSQMLKHIVSVAPRGVYVCGNSTTNAGLTATLIRDQFTNEQTLEAGALVLSDLGICCIDEFDKMTSDQNSLLEAMEQQTISIAKGGILGSLSARCTIIACANPHTGHYNRSRTILENIRVSNAILSRFDLVFLLLDDPDLQRDRKLSEHVMKLHSRNRKRKLDMFASELQEQQNIEGGSNYQSSFLGLDKVVKRMKYADSANSSQAGIDDDDELQEIVMNQSQMSNREQEIQYASLTQKVKTLMEKIKESEQIQPQLLKKYLSFAKHTVFPKLSIEACEVIKDFYISLRINAVNNANSLPITSRQLDSLIRLSEARAKLEFRNLVTKQDAMDVVKLVQESLFEACYMEMMNVNRSMMNGGGYGQNQNQVNNGNGQSEYNNNSYFSNGQYQQQNSNNYNNSGNRSGSASQRGRGGQSQQQIDVMNANVAMMSIPKQTKVYVERLRSEADMRQSKLFEFNEMIRIGKEINLQVGDFKQFLDKLNSQGILIMKPNKVWELN